MRPALIALILAFLFVGTFIPFSASQNARATAWYSSAHSTNMPSAYDGNLTMPIGSSPVQVDYGPKIWLDGLTWIDLYSRYGSTVSVTTGNFNNPTYPAATYLINGFHVFENMSLQSGNHAPANATIVYVWLVSLWSSVMNQPWIPLLNMKMTHDSGGWRADRQPMKIALANPVLTCIGLNITGDQTWNRSLLTSPSFHVRLTMNLPANTLYNLDYLGLLYLWYYNVPGSPGFNPVTGDYPGNLTIPSVTGILGIVGFVGMIGTPAFGIWMARSTEQDRLPLILKMAVVFIACFGIFYASITI